MCRIPRCPLGQIYQPDRGELPQPESVWIRHIRLWKTTDLRTFGGFHYF
jgi:hypothetical protein